MLIPHKTAAALPVPEMRRDLGAALGANYRGGRWFESTAAHHCFRNANRRSGKPEGWDDAVPTFNPYLDHQLFEQSFALARRSVELCFTESFSHVAHDLGARRNEHFFGVGFPNVFQTGAKLGEPGLERLYSAEEPRLG